jgi:hypothetical protein
MAKGHCKPSVEALENRTVPSTIAGFVYDDLNNNGIMDPGEHGIAGNTIELHNAAGTLLATAITDANGHYAFSIDPTINTAPVTKEFDAQVADTRTDYTKDVSVSQFDPSLGTLTGVEIINDATFTSAIKIESLDNAPSEVTATVSGTLALQGPGVNSLVTSPENSEKVNVDAFDGTMDFAGPSGHDFGTKRATGSQAVTLSAANQDLSAFVGTGAVNFTETAHATSSASGPGNLLSMINSTASGNLRVIYHYTPSNALRPGTYTLVQPKDPDGFLDGKDTSDNLTPIPGSDRTDTITVNLGNSDQLNNNFGELEPASLSGFVYHDHNDNGVKELVDEGLGGVTINLTGTDDRGDPVSLSQQTAADGSYSFGNLRPGNYSLVKATQPDGFLDGKNTIGSQGGQASGNSFTQISLSPGVAGANNNFAEVLPGSLAGFVYLDVNNNGVIEPGDPPIPGTTITLTGTDSLGNAISQQQQTAADGSYLFTGLRPGNYTITETQPAGFNEGQNTLGSLSGTLGADQFFVTLPAEQAGTNYNFGEVLPPTPAPPRVADTPTPASAAATPLLSKRDFIGNVWGNFGW